MTEDLWILSYDVHGRDRATSVRVCRVIFGRRNTTTREGLPATYDVPGFIHRPGGVWSGQPALGLPRAASPELPARLGSMGGAVCLGRRVTHPRNVAQVRRRARR